jgi:hypothetical protein
VVGAVLKRSYDGSRVEEEEVEGPAAEELAGLTESIPPNSTTGEAKMSHEEEEVESVED